MFIQLQPPTPYQDSLLWELHRQYYQQAGAQAFLKQEVPYNISSNPCMAQSAVLLLLESEPSGTVDVLEIGAGLGVFALNFLQALQAASPETLLRTRYWLSDFSQAGLQSLAQHPAFARWIEQGVLQLCFFDAQAPQQARDLEGQPLNLPAQGFQLTIANYVLSTLPTAVLLKQAEQWLGQLTELEWLPLGPEPSPAAVLDFCQQIAQALEQDRLLEQVSAEHPQYQMFKSLQAAQRQLAQRLRSELPSADQDFKSWLQTELSSLWAHELRQNIADPAGLAALNQTAEQLVIRPLLERASYPPEQLKESHRFEPLEPAQYFEDAQHFQVIQSLTQDWPLASVGYSAAALKSLAALLKLTAPGGLILISDKAYADAEWMHGIQPEIATRHGQSLAHPVNFPLLAAWLQQQGKACLRTHDPAQALHSLLIFQGDSLPEPLHRRFEQEFISYPKNEISHALLEGGHALMQQEALEQAGRCLQRALSYRPADGTLQYLLAVCLLNQQHYAQALSLLEQPHDDYFGLLNREILQAESYRLLEQFERAIPLYQASLRHGENAQTYYNLALCQLELGLTDQARASLESAAELDPEDAEIQQLLQNFI